METNHLIQLEQFCSIQNVDADFILALQEYELVELVVREKIHYLPVTQLPTVEKMVRLHYELDINLEGIDAIATLLKKIDALEQELIATKNKLQVFEHHGDL